MKITKFHEIFLYTPNNITFRVARSVKRPAKNLWIAGSNLAPVLPFISFVEFYKCHFGEMLQILKILRPWL